MGDCQNCRKLERKLEDLQNEHDYLEGTIDDIRSLFRTTTNGEYYDNPSVEELVEVVESYQKHTEEFIKCIRYFVQRVEERTVPSKVTYPTDKKHLWRFDGGWD